MIKRIQDLGNNWPIRLITIDARENLVKWYEELEFVRMKVNSSGQDGVTVAMYYDCGKYEKELQEYLENMYE